MIRKNIFCIYQLIIVGIFLVFTMSCEKDEPIKEELSLITYPVGDITSRTAVCGGYITSDGGSAIIAKGVCWSTDQTPTIYNNKTDEGTGVGSYTSNLTSLTPNTKYYIRAYASNSIGTKYGSVVSFSTKNEITYGIMIDIDENTYKTVTIGTQVWMAENLKVTKYRNGDIIGTTTPYTLDISDENIPKYQWAAGGDESNVATYGRLYTYYAITDTRSIAPDGWHIPTYEEWTTLTDYLKNNDLGYLSGNWHWCYVLFWTNDIEYYNQITSNSSGFSALASGFRYAGGGFFGNTAEWWSSTETDLNNAIRLEFTCGINSLEKDKRFGLSVRCLQDD